MNDYNPIWLLLIPAAALAATFALCAAWTVLILPIAIAVGRAFNAGNHPAAPERYAATSIEADDYWKNWPAYFADWDTEDDRLEDRLDRELRDGLTNWGKPA